MTEPRRQWSQALRQPAGRFFAGGAALCVLLLAAAATWWPRPVERTGGPVVIVLDPSGDERRQAETWPALARVLAAPAGQAPQVVVVGTTAEFRSFVALGPEFLVCPDGVALGLDPAAWTPLAAGRRAAPRNLRPHSVLVSRRGASDGPEPWLSRPGGVVFGDSLSLTATGVLRAVAGALPGLPAGVAWGPDPYDHAAALHALRLGKYDHAVVRQWDADRFFAQGLLSADGWERREVTVPVPDLVLLAARSLPTSARLALGERLAGIGRELADLTPAERELAAALPAVGLAGFNLLIDPDFELVRGNFAADWPRLRP